jgi:hypothetical protein
MGTLTLVGVIAQYLVGGGSWLNPKAARTREPLKEQLRAAIAVHRS